MHSRKLASVVVLGCVPGFVACGGGKSPAEKAQEALVQARAACAVFDNFKSPTGDSSSAQIAFAKASGAAFKTANDHAKRAAALDPTWARLASSSKAEADAFAVIVSASTVGVTTAAAQANVLKAVDISRSARLVFIAQCAKVDPKRFTTPPSSSASPSASPSPTGSNDI